MKVAIGIVTVLDQKLFISFTLLSTGFKNSTVADARTDVIAESDRRVDDARVGGHRLCRWRRLIHDGTAEMSGGGEFMVPLWTFIWSWGKEKAGQAWVRHFISQEGQADAIKSEFVNQMKDHVQDYNNDTNSLTFEEAVKDVSNGSLMASKIYNYNNK